jgi:hypothetical protein
MVKISINILFASFEIGLGVKFTLKCLFAYYYDCFFMYTRGNNKRGRPQITLSLTHTSMLYYYTFVYCCGKILLKTRGERGNFYELDKICFFYTLIVIFVGFLRYNKKLCHCFLFFFLFLFFFFFFFNCKISKKN